MIDYAAMILNVEGLDPDWRQSGMKLPRPRFPTYLHLDKVGAEKELLRLQQENPRSEFVLLEMTAKSELVTEQPCDALDRWKEKHGLFWGKRIARLAPVKGGQQDAN
jgi:hypothetical protein